MEATLALCEDGLTLSIPSTALLLAAIACIQIVNRLSKQIAMTILLYLPAVYLVGLSRLQESVGRPTPYSCCSMIAQFFAQVFPVKKDTGVSY